MQKNVWKKNQFNGHKFHFNDKGQWLTANWIWKRLGGFRLNVMLAAVEYTQRNKLRCPSTFWLSETFTITPNASWNNWDVCSMSRFSQLMGVHISHRNEDRRKKCRDMHFNLILSHWVGVYILKRDSSIHHSNTFHD